MTEPSAHGRLGKPVEKQITLPWSKAAEIAFRSLKVRFFRSLITMVGVILAIAFMMSILASQTIIDHLVALNDPEINYLLQGEGVDTAQSAESNIESKQQTIWIITLSLSVALIGIVNSMLMSVTERFREIGTMKCLGALDSFIIRLFLLESSFQGMIGTVIGVIIGLSVAIAWKGSRYGFTTTITAPEIWFKLLGWSVFSLLVGTTIGVLAAIYPAISAARMEPVDAMRVDE